MPSIINPDINLSAEPRSFVPAALGVDFIGTTSFCSLHGAPHTKAHPASEHLVLVMVTTLGIGMVKVIDTALLTALATTMGMAMVTVMRLLHGAVCCPGRDRTRLPGKAFDALVTGAYA